jgi:hypothetical protein
MGASFVSPIAMFKVKHLARGNLRMSEKNIHQSLVHSESKSTLFQMNNRGKFSFMPHFTVSA